MDKAIFRKVSLERLSSPEQLDQMMRVTTPAGWVSLWAAAAVLAIAIVWGITGSLPTTVQGKGILLRTGGVFDVVAGSAGTIKAVYLGPNDVVVRGQIVARVDRPDLLDQLRTAKLSVADLRRRREQVAQYGSEETRLQLISVVQQQTNLVSIITNETERIASLEAKLANEKNLAADGLITQSQLLSTRDSLNQSRERIRSSQNQLQELDVLAVQKEARKAGDLAAVDLQINDLDRRVRSLQDDLDASSKVISPYTGRILEVGVDEGAVVAKGQPLLKIELTGNEIKNLEAVLYFPPGDGKKIKPGMMAQVSPATVEQSEFGCALGLVTFVSDYPSTQQSMQRTLKNEALVRDLAAGGTPIEVRVDLIPAPQNPSGYQWSSSKGPDLALQTGTLCGSTVTVAQQRPISLVIPLLKKQMLGIGEEQRKTAAP